MEKGLQKARLDQAAVEATLEQARAKAKIDGEQRHKVIAPPPPPPLSSVISLSPPPHPPSCPPSLSPSLSHSHSHSDTHTHTHSDCLNPESSGRCGSNGWRREGKAEVGTV